jgi:threonine 3-dehydrogenase
MKMKALMKTEKAPGAKVMQTDVPKIGPRDLLIKVKATAICGTDIHIYNWNAYAQARIKPPMVFGHESCGEVVEVGSLVTNFKVGDLVAVETHIPDETCYMCQTGLPHICENMKIIGVHVDGTFAEYAKIPAVCAWKLPKGTDPELGAILEPMGVAVNGALKGEINNRSVAVFGCGPIGLCGIGACHAWGASKIFAVEVSEDRLKMVKQFAPEAILVNPTKVDAVKTIMDGTEGRGVDVSLEISGNAKAAQMAFKVIRRAGRVSLIGLHGGPVELSLNEDIIYKEARVYGSTGRMMWQTWWDMKALLESGRFNPLPVITHRMKMEEFDQAIKLAESGKAGKILIYA